MFVKIIILFSSLLCLLQANAYEFQNFKLNKSINDIQHANFSGKNHQSITNKSSRNNDLSQVLKELMDEYRDEYKNIANRLVKPIIIDHDMGGGVKNYSGFSWYKPLLNFKVYVNRQVSPDIFSDEWLVQDKLVILVNAKSLLTNLANDSVIEIDSDILAAYAGLHFQRTYQITHRSSSYIEGIQSDFTKLFFPFLHMRPQQLLRLNSELLLRKTDSLSFSLKAAASLPNLYYNDLYASADFETSLVTQTEFEMDKDQQFKASLEKSYSKKVGLSLGMQADFLELLKLTLISYEMDYSLESSYKHYLNFNQKDLSFISNDPYSFVQFKKFIHSSDKNLSFWQPYLVSYEQRREEKLKSRFSILHFGSTRQKATQTLEFDRNGIKSTFYKNTSHSIKIKQNILSKLLSSKILNYFNLNQTPITQETKEMVIEYKQQRDRASYLATNEQDFSLRLSLYFNTNSTIRKKDQKKKREAIKKIYRYGAFSKDLVSFIKDDRIIAPLYLESHLYLQERQIQFFNGLSPKDTIERIAHLCEYKKSKSWIMRRFKRIFSRSSKCFTKLKKRYLSYYEQKGEFINVNLFKKFVGQLFKETHRLSDLSPFFGDYFVKGQIKANKNDGQPFKDFFEQGIISHYGVIDKFLRTP